MKKLEDLEELPTILYIEQEISVMHDLMEMPHEYISSNKEAFVHIIKNLVHSHRDSGWLGLTRSNESEFVEFTDWLEALDKELNLGVWPVLLMDLRLRYDDLLETYPDLWC